MTFEPKKLIILKAILVIGGADSSNLKYTAKQSNLSYFVITLTLIETCTFFISLYGAIQINVKIKLHQKTYAKNEKNELWFWIFDNSINNFQS